MAKTAETAVHLDLSERRIFELQAKNVILRAGRGEIDLDLARISYIRHLRDNASGRQTPGELEHMGPEFDHAVRRTNVLRGPMNPNRLAETEDTLAHTDRLWRSEMKRVYGADGVLVYGFSQAGRGEDGSRIRQAFDARQIAVNAWRHERRPQV